MLLSLYKDLHGFPHELSKCNVHLIKDVSETDPYDRLLCYVIAGDIFVNYELVVQAYANTASYPPDFPCIPTFQAAELEASIVKLGLWAAPPTSVPLATQPLGNATCNCTAPDLDCGDFNSHSSAQTCFDYCQSKGFGDVFRLDRDHDGLAREGRLQMRRLANMAC